MARCVGIGQNQRPPTTPKLPQGNFLEGCSFQVAVVDSMRECIEEHNNKDASCKRKVRNFCKLPGNFYPIEDPIPRDEP